MTSRLTTGRRTVIARTPAAELHALADWFERKPKENK